MKVVTVSTQKGGAGKTTSAVHLAVGLNRAGYRVLVVDLDAQAHASKWLLPAIPRDALGAAGVLESGEPPAEEDLLPVPNRPGLSVLPASLALRKSNITLRENPGADRVLSSALAPIGGSFDFCIIDTPPAVELVTYNALAAADYVLVPVTSAFLALDGLGELQKTLELVRSRTNPRLEVLGYLHLAVTKGYSNSTEVREILQKKQGSKLLKCEIRTSSVQMTIAAHRLTAWDKEAGDERGLEDWTAVQAEILGRMGVKAAAKPATAKKQASPKSKAVTTARSVKGTAKVPARKARAT
ncbi:ParA family protein [Myxococcus llanfairpwllgwyngyllgogerychwyrndrobwllllantysiliogogogochensis]|uniref:ParA family protein n=1 Tax=Myxococcus llanfairpwllgwyngyllgogerychwyrndrobwllllantysiliogogogochensis TaxID=2590453 RepID=UPI0015F0F40A|nr:AAA family ATPase [Myxococcus llanfairpwllgwyngyllgogerychwyrndrobwllllantysiliogogogochensis]